ncbi:hypothetical protein DFP72DRAFT_863218 [Ephemerocybe angulata]|uniref:Uncharacterized protein n=1 Tax=Ephemerocybe angulata TaxID=980116 RepID=A0A8H6H618_9AGAR|nr:hypothetical protein DFP72DRAFT_863218 [Tulosesus angulatus]
MYLLLRGPQLNSGIETWNQLFTFITHARPMQHIPHSNHFNARLPDFYSTRFATVNNAMAGLALYAIPWSPTPHASHTDTMSALAVQGKGYDGTRVCVLASLGSPTAYPDMCAVGGYTYPVQCTSSSAVLNGDGPRRIYLCTRTVLRVQSFRYVYSPSSHPNLWAAMVHAGAPSVDISTSALAIQCECRVSEAVHALSTEACAVGGQTHTQALAARGEARVESATVYHAPGANGTCVYMHRVEAPTASADVLTLAHGAQLACSACGYPVGENGSLNCVPVRMGRGKVWERAW